MIKVPEGNIFKKSKLLLIAVVVVLCYGCKMKKESIANQGREIIFSEGFEVLSIPEILINWNDTKNTKGMSLNNDVPESSKGKQSLMMTYNPGLDEGGHLYKSFPEGYDTLYARFYVKFLTRKSRIHHFVKMGGNNPPLPYPQGNAGKLPKGDDRFITGIEPNKNFNWVFYTYWMHMFGNHNGYWGNTFLSDPVKKAPKEEWICVEFMIKLNDNINGSNGEQAFWINGEKILHLGKNFPKFNKKGGNYIESPTGANFKGFQWRKDEKLKLNYFWLSYYMTKGDKGEIEQVLFDDIVVATEYIGPMNSSKKINIKNKAMSIELE